MCLPHTKNTSCYLFKKKIGVFLVSHPFSSLDKLYILIRSIKNLLKNAESSNIKKKAPCSKSDYNFNFPGRKVGKPLLQKCLALSIEFGPSYNQTYFVEKFAWALSFITTEVIM